jgi:Fe-S oxidoreductase
LNLSCSTQFVPHLMLDIVAVFEALGVDFAAGASRTFCCGTYYRRTGKLESTNKQAAAVGRRVLAWGAPTQVNTRTQCTNTFGDIQRRRTFVEGLDEAVDHINHTDYLSFIDERLTELGDKVPRRKELSSKIIIHGHPTYSWIEERAKRDVAKVATHIPGVEVVGMLDRISIDSFCSTQPGDQIYERPKTREGVAFFRDELAAQAELWGADTLSPSHHHCLTIWAPYASNRVDVRHDVSQLAEALGVGHTDRYKAACQLGSIEEIVEQTRPMWSAWKMSEEKAFETAHAVFDPNWSTVGQCACGKSNTERCGHDSLIGVDVLTGSARRGRRAEKAQP